MNPARRPPSTFRGGERRVIGARRGRCPADRRLDAESPVLARGEKYLGHLTTMPHQAFGLRVGVPRSLDLVDRHQPPTPVFVRV
ncbi:hypothetical protein [Micromonospora sp. ATCC 39149]|uniref:hypothetical protein n=1 Tax=Micromonospora sp. (strain ATCC 39149 / NRRL 15099 / SCC 1413) TaxID=219305 RepID=UPI0018DD6839|nr:hypothetical protein [Micromonospora sp. ATCC 39149]